jgi:uncharacterized protein YlxW (UPF0749 family)
LVRNKQLKWVQKLDKESDKAMLNNNKWVFSIAITIIGFMIAIHFHSVQTPEVRDTRDMWAIRSQLQVEQEKQQLLQQELNELTTVVKSYQESSEQEQIATLNQSIDVLEEKAGLTKLTAPGVVIELRSSYRMSPELRGTNVTPELLNRLINELNTYGATAIGIENERLIDLTSIRYVAGRTYMNQRPLPDLPIKIKVLVDDPERLKSYMEVSQSKDELGMNNIDFTVSSNDKVTVPSYQGNINLNLIQFDQTKEAGEG